MKQSVLDSAPTTSPQPLQVDVGAFENAMWYGQLVHEQSLLAWRRKSFFSAASSTPAAIPNRRQVTIKLSRWEEYVYFCSSYSVARVPYQYRRNEDVRRR